MAGAENPILLIIKFESCDFTLIALCLVLTQPFWCYGFDSDFRSCS